MVCGFAALAVARYAFDLPIMLAALVGTAGYFLLPIPVLRVSMRVSRFFIERTPEGGATMAAHDAEQAEAWRAWEDVKRRRAAGEAVDPTEVDRLQGILFRNEGVLGTGHAPLPAPKAAMTAPLVKISTDRGKRGPDWMMSNVGPELAVYFRPSPSDQVWKGITEENAAAYQLWFQRMVLRGNLRSLHSSIQITDEIGATLVSVANEALDTHHLQVPLLLILAHQYVDADQMMRGLNTTCWVAKMVERNDYAPSPESYVEYLRERFFLRPS